MNKAKIRIMNGLIKSSRGKINPNSYFMLTSRSHTFAKIQTTLLVVAVVVATSVSFYPETAHAITCGFGSDIGGGECRGFITSGTTFAVPSDWNSNSNTVETIGGGGSGNNVSNGQGGAGGGGGGYSKKTNVTVSGTVTINVGAGGGGGGGGSGG